MTTLCVTGWQQPADALSCIAPADAMHADYSEHTSVAAFLETLPKEVDLAIGWSLGGQLLVRAIAGKHVKVKRLVLLGAPFQFIAGLKIPYGMPSDMMPGIIDNYRSDPQKMLGEFAGIIAAGDKNAASIMRTLRQNLSVWKAGMFWLKELGRYSCEELNFFNFPQTSIIHGDADKVIYPEQAELFAKKIPNAKTHLIPACGHAPHLHDAQAIRTLVHV